jgi:N-carbamoyl-L-amino-acid hydrolase
MPRLAQELDTLASFTDAPAPAVTRVVFSETDRRARRYFKERCEAAGLTIREDAVGNTFARWIEDSASPGPAIASGSHTDAIPNAGRFDGSIGVFGALEAVRALKECGVRPARPIDIVMFTSEEPTRFGLGCLGSRLMSGSVPADVADGLRDSDGRTLNEIRHAAGFKGALADVRLRADTYAAFVELHIEQGPILEREGDDIGIVTAIAAPASLRLFIEGKGGHAGAMLMPDRHDAFLAAAEIALATESAARGAGSIDSVATVGVCDVFPGAINSVPSRVRIEIDVRDIDLPRRDRMVAEIAAAAADVAARRGVTIRTEYLNADPPAACAPELITRITSACDARRLRHRALISRAYHDSLFMARIAPTAMIFIPCRGGISHRPDEYASPEAIANGVAVLADTLADLAR